MGFSKERIGHGTHFLRFLTEVARKYSFNHIGIECANTKSYTFAKKLGFDSIDGENYATTVDSLTSYFFNGMNVILSFSEYKGIFRK